MEKRALSDGPPVLTLVVLSLLLVGLSTSPAASVSTILQNSRMQFDVLINGSGGPGAYVGGYIYPVTADGQVSASFQFSPVPRHSYPTTNFFLIV